MTTRLPDMRPSWRARQEAAWSRMREEYGTQAGGSSGKLDQAAAAMQEAVASAIGRLDQATRRGDRVLALCPFHDDKRLGSFHVNPRTGWFTCYACDTRGGIFRLLSQLGMDDVALKEATRGVNLRVLSDFVEGVDTSSASDKRWVLPESLLRKYDARPLRLVEKGHPKALIDSLEIGFDEERLRITFPVRRVTGELVAIQTRAVGLGDPARWKFYRREILDDLPKDVIDAYQLSGYTPPRTSIFFNEHNVLSGLLDGSITRPVVLCEGPGHVLRVIASGFPCIGSFGVSLAEPQLDRLVDALRRAQAWAGSRRRLIVATDGDLAGRMSAFKTALRIGPKADVRIARIPPGADPEDLTVRELRPLILGAEPLRSYLDDPREVGDWARTAVATYARDAVKEAERAERRAEYLRKNPQGFVQENDDHVPARKRMRTPHGRVG